LEQDPTAPVFAGEDGAPPPGYLELYKLAVEMADRVSARRATANSFFLAINAGLAALVGSQDLRWYVAAAGIVFAVAWWGLLKAYRDLNGAKFEVINAMEARLPAQLFSEEWSLIKSRRVTLAVNRSSLLDWIRQPLAGTPPRRRLSRAGRALRDWTRAPRELGEVERVVPWVFALIYLAEIIRQAAA
jgi:hypothetical protein